MDPLVQIETIKVDNFNRKLRNELDYIRNSGNMGLFSNINHQNIDERTTLLETLLNVPIEKKDSFQQQKNNLFKELDKYIYKKQWNKLLPFHKIVKIKEYLKETIQNETMHNELVVKLSKLAEEGKINTKKFVIYDPSAEKILSMPCLVIEENTYQIKGL